MATRWRFILTGENRTDRAFRGLDRNLQRSQRLFQQFSGALGATFGAAGVGLAVRSIARAGVEIQRMERTFRASTDSSRAARQELNFVRREADRLGLELRSTADQYAKLTAASRGTRLEGEATRELFTAAAEAGRVLGLSVDQQTGIFRAFEQMISKGNVQAEELRGQLGERLPGAFQLAAKAMGVSTSELNKMLEQGKVLAEELLPLMARQMRQMFAPEVESAATDAQAAFNRFATSIFDLKVAIAESGVLDGIAKLADLTSVAARGAEQFIEALNGHMTDEQVRAKQIEQMTENVSTLEQEYRDLWQAMIDGSASTEDVDFGRRALDEARATLAAFKAEAPVTGGNTLAKQIDEARQFTAWLQAQREHFASLKLPVMLSPEQAEREFAAAEREFAEFRESTSKGFMDLSTDVARGFSSVLADLFMGTERSFGDMLRRMAAQFAASAITRGLLGLVAGGSGAFATLAESILPGFQHGGSFRIPGNPAAGDSRVVAFAGAGGENVTVTPSRGKTQGPSIMLEQHMHFDVGLESVDERIAQITPSVAQATYQAIERIRSRPRMS